eukprot:gene3721-2620_t
MNGSPESWQTRQLNSSYNISGIFFFVVGAYAYSFLYTTCTVHTLLYTQEDERTTRAVVPFGGIYTLEEVSPVPNYTTYLGLRCGCIGGWASPCTRLTLTRFLTTATLTDIAAALRSLKAEFGREVRFSCTSEPGLRIETRKPSSGEWELLTECSSSDSLANAIELASSTFAERMSATPAQSPRSPTNVVFDFSVGQQRDPRMEASETLQRRFPGLVLHTTHTTGIDLQGNKTHTIAVELRPATLSSTTTTTTTTGAASDASSSAEKETCVPAASLTDAEKEAMKRFRGESVGLGYRGTLKRAIAAAFKSLGDAEGNDGGNTTTATREVARGIQNTSNAAAAPMPGSPTACAPCVLCVLRLYAQVIKAPFCVQWDPLTTSPSTFRVVLTESSSSAASGDCIQRTPKILGEGHVNRDNGPIAALLAALERAAAAYDAIGCAEVRDKVDGSGLYVLLPERAVNIKHVLEKILQFYLGAEPSALVVEVAHNNGLFVSSVTVTIPLPALGLAETAVKVLLAHAVGRSKKHANELAMVKAIEVHFPRLYEEQIAFHPEVQRMRSNEQASDKGDEVCPHISRGLLCQLEWACQREGLVLEMDAIKQAPPPLPRDIPSSTTTEMNPNSSSSSSDAATSASVLSSEAKRSGAVAPPAPPVTSWTTTIRLLRPSGARVDTAEGSEAASPVVFAYSFTDLKKSRSSQKAIAATLFTRYGSLCREAIAYAMQQRLLNSDGSPCVVEKLAVEHTALRGVEQDEMTAACSSDPLLQLLTVTPYQFVRPTLLRRDTCAAGNEKDATQQAGMTAPPLLHVYRCWANSFAQQRYQSRYALMTETLQPGSPEGSATLTAVLQSSEGETLEQLVYVTVRHKLPIRALLRAYVHLCETAEASGDNDTTTAVREAHTALVRSVPAALPADLPLSTVAALVMQVYGMGLLLHCGTEQSRTVVRLYGVDPTILPAATGVSLVPSSPPDRVFLGKGEGGGLMQAVLMACRGTFQTHFGVLKCAFEDEELGKLWIPRLMIKMSLPCDTKCEGLLTVSVEPSPVGVSSTSRNPDKKPLVSLAFQVTAGEKMVELERASDTDFLTAYLSICNNICTETRFPFHTPKRLLEANLNQFQRLSLLLTQHFGLHLHCETLARDRTWHCRLSLSLDSSHTHRWCLCTSHSTKKNEAVEAAAVCIMRRHFPKLFTDCSVPPTLVSLCGTNATETGYCYNSRSRYIIICDLVHLPRNLPQQNGLVSLSFFFSLPHVPLIFCYCRTSPKAFADP